MFYGKGTITFSSPVMLPMVSTLIYQTHVRSSANITILEKNAIIPSFSHWRFPRDDLPQFWMPYEFLRLPHDRPVPVKVA